jgi:hypothetical protein
MVFLPGRRMGFAERIDVATAAAVTVPGLGRECGL